MNEIPAVSHSGFLALVSYIPDPLRSFLSGLRRNLPGTDNPEPHITVLPRRLLRLENSRDPIPAVESVSREARWIVSQFPAFEVELSAVRHFVGTNVLYLDVADGNDRLHELHDALNTGALAHPEEFEFRPHLTLSGPVSDENLRSAQERAEQAWAAASCSRRFTVQEIVCLWLSSNGAQAEWRRAWSEPLAAKTTARGAS